MYRLIILFIFSFNLFASDLLNRNNFQIIEINGDSVILKSESFTVIWDGKTNELNSLINENNQIPERKKISQDYPKGYGRAAYVGVKDRAIKKSNEVILFNCASEGCYSFSLIADVERKKSHNCDEYAETVNFDSQNIYIGKKNGFAILKRETDWIDEYLILPFINSQSQVLKNANYLVLTADRIGIELINRQSNEIELIKLEDINDYKYNIKGLPFFTNIIETEHSIILGCRLIYDESMGAPAGKKSYLLFFDKNQHTWDIQEINKECLFRIINADNRLILIFRQVELSEGDPHTNHGGISSYDLLSKENTMLTKNDDEMIKSFKLDSSFLKIKTYYEEYIWKERDSKVICYEYEYNFKFNSMLFIDSSKCYETDVRYDSLDFLKDIQEVDLSILRKNEPELNSLKPVLFLYDRRQTYGREVDK